MYYTVELKHHVINGNYSYSEFGFDELDDAVKFAKKEGCQLTEVYEHNANNDQNK